jgi:hypothetical protein
MKKLLPVTTIILCLAVAFPAIAQTKKPTPGAKTSCTPCHADLQSVLPKSHKPVAGNTIAACTTCHKPDVSGKPEPKAYSARLHRSHAKEGSTTDCTVCHTWGPKQFGLVGTKASLGVLPKDEIPVVKKAFDSWAGSKHLDASHAKADIVCLACHGKTLPTTGDNVENNRCLVCHGSMDALVAKSAPKDFPDRNPHKSHLGDIACSVCHHGHKPSKVYCLGCHGKFTMKIPAGE